MNSTVQLLINHKVAMLFVAVLAEQAGLPTPIVPLLLAVGSLARLGHMNLAGSISVAMVACLSADFFWYQVGRQGRSNLLRQRTERAQGSENCMRRKMAAALNRHGAGILLLAKFLPGPNLASPLAGFSGFTPLRFLFFDSLASMIWAGGTIAVGYCFGMQLQCITQYGPHI